MTIIYRCNRCHTEDDLHTRKVEVTPVGVDLRTMAESDDGPWHLCGFCTSQLRKFIKREAP